MDNPLNSLATRLYSAKLVKMVALLTRQLRASFNCLIQHSVRKQTEKCRRPGKIKPNINKSSVQELRKCIMRIEQEIVQEEKRNRELKSLLTPN